MVSLITVLGALAVAGGGITYLATPLGLEYGIKSSINLKKNGMVFPLYIKPPFTQDSAYYLFGIQNPREVLRGEKMKLKLRGPFVYTYNMMRDNITFAPNDESVKFDTHKLLRFDAERSADGDERFWILNPIIPSVQKTVRSMLIDRVPFQRLSEPIVFNALNVLLDNYKERLIVKRSARELLDGKRVAMLDFLTSMANRFGLGSLIPPGPPENTFGLVFVQNKTVDSMELWTGIGKPEKFGDVRRWKDQERMNIWKGRCNVINGTNAELYKPFISGDDSMKVFLKDFCRTFDLDPVGEEKVQVQDGLMALEYEISPRLYFGSRNNPDNKCYCKESRTYDCQYDGLLNMGPCFFDAPIYFARPKFKGVDRRIRSLIDENITNFEIPEKQSFYLDATTGSILRVNFTLMGLVKVVKQAFMRDLGKVQNLTYAPFFTVSEIVSLPSSVTWQVKILQIFLEYYKQGAMIMSGTGVSILLLKFLFGGKKKKQPKQTQPSTSGQTNSPEQEAEEVQN